MMGQSFRNNRKKLQSAEFHPTFTQKVKNKEKSNEVVQANHTYYLSLQHELLLLKVQNLLQQNSSYMSLQSTNQKSSKTA